MADVFISYAHVDNEKTFDQQLGWIDWFFTTFSTKMRQLCGPVVEVWRDSKIDGNDALTPKIKAEVSAARVLVSIVTPSYLQSTWCGEELRLFCEAQASSGGITVGTKSRVVKVIKTPVDRSLEAALYVDISDFIGYPFFRIRENGKHWEFDPMLGSEARDEFYRQIYELALDTKELLSASVEKKSGLTIFVAEPGEDLSGDVERLRRELRQAGHTVVPEAPYGYGPAYERRVRADIARSDITIHPISASLGPIPESSDRRVVVLQYDLSADVAREKPLQRISWMQAGMRVDGVADEGLRQQLERDESLRICTLEELKTAVETLVKKLNEPPAPVPANATNDRTSIYVVCDGEDAALAGDVGKALVDAGNAVTLPLFEGDETERRGDHEDSLATCDAILVVHGSSTDLWRRTKLRDMKRAFGNGRHKPFLARGLILVGAAVDGQGDMLDPDLIVMRSHGGDLAPALAPFLAALKRNKDTAV